MSETIFTSESVTRGHPDKLCDQISDAAVDAFLRKDPAAHASIECAVATGVVFLAARFAADATVDLPALARDVIADAGYADRSFDARKCSILTSFLELPVTARTALPSAGDEEALNRYAAQDPANVFGFACRDTPELMPLPISLAHRLARALDEARSTMPFLSRTRRRRSPSSIATPGRCASTRSRSPQSMRAARRAPVSKRRCAIARSMPCVTANCGPAETSTCMSTPETPMKRAVRSAMPA